MTRDSEGEVWCPRRGDLFAAVSGRYPTAEDIRAQGLGNVPGPDGWDTDRFERTEGRDYVRWKWAWMPRTCSYCGGVHPEDAIRLITEGWECEATGKSYKWYLHPPGTAARFERQMAWLRERHEALAAGQPGPNPPQKDENAWDATPPVKLYTPHFDNEQAVRFNHTLKSQQPAAPDATADESSGG